MPAMRTVLTAALVALLATLGLPLAAPALAAAPTITSFTPSSGPPGTLVTITGTTFAAPATARFGGVAAPLTTVLNATTIAARVPAAGVSGPITVVDAYGTATSASAFTVTAGVTLSPLAGPPGSTVTVTFAGLAANEAADVYFDTNELALVTSNASGVGTATITVPAATQPGAHWFSVVGRRSGSAAQAAFTVRSSWLDPAATAGGTGYAATESALSPGTVPDLEEDWGIAGCANCRTSEPAVSGGIVVVVSSRNSPAASTVRAFTEATGALRWSYSEPTVADPETPVIAGNTVNVADAFGVIALNLTTGAVLWTHALPDFVLHLLVAGSTLYVSAAGTSTSALYALAAATGTALWPWGCGNDNIGQPSFGAGLVFVVCASNGYGAGLLAALEPDGSLAWSAPVQTLGPEPVTVATGHVLLADLDGSGDPQVQTFVASSGALVATVTPPAGDVLSGVAIAHGVAYCGTDTGSGWAFDPVTGATKWFVGVQDLIDWHSTPTVAGGVVFFPGETQSISAIAAATGARLWTGGTAGTVEGPQAVAVDGAIFTLDSGALVRFTIGGSDTPAARRPAVRSLHPIRANGRPS